MNDNGFTLTELIVAVGILAVLSSIGIISYIGYMERARVYSAIETMAAMSTEIVNHGIDTGVYPNSLNETGYGNVLDPWGNPYQYLNIRNAPPGARGQMRKDRFLVPINSDFDLYSMGKDGQTRPPLVTPVSRDDVIRANDGAYFGLSQGF